MVRFRSSRFAPPAHWSSKLKVDDTLPETKVRKLLCICCQFRLLCWLNVTESAYNVGDKGLIFGSGRSPGGGNGNPLQYTCLGNPMDRGTWWVIVQRVAKIRTNSAHTHSKVVRELSSAFRMHSVNTLSVCIIESCNLKEWKSSAVSSLAPQVKSYSQKRIPHLLQIVFKILFIV